MINTPRHTVFSLTPLVVKVVRGLEIYFINYYILYKYLKKQRNERPLADLQYIKNCGRPIERRFQAKTRFSFYSALQLWWNPLEWKAIFYANCSYEWFQVCSPRINARKRHQITVIITSTSRGYISEIVLSNVT